MSGGFKFRRSAFRGQEPKAPGGMGGAGKELVSVGGLVEVGRFFGGAKEEVFFFVVNVGQKETFLGGNCRFFGGFF